MDDGVLNWKALKSIVPLSRTQIRRMEKSGSFVRSFKLGRHHNSTRVWSRREVIEWLRHQSGNSH